MQVRQGEDDKRGHTQPCRSAELCVCHGHGLREADADAHDILGLNALGREECTARPVAVVLDEVMLFLIVESDSFVVDGGHIKVAHFVIAHHKPHPRCRTTENVGDGLIIGIGAYRDKRALSRRKTKKEQASSSE